MIYKVNNINHLRRLDFSFLQVHWNLWNLIDFPELCQIIFEERQLHCKLSRNHQTRSHWFPIECFFEIFFALVTFEKISNDKISRNNLINIIPTELLHNNVVLIQITFFCISIFMLHTTRAEKFTIVPYWNYFSILKFDLAKSSLLAILIFAPLQFFVLNFA